MKLNHLFFAVTAGLIVAGCASEDQGDVEAARKAAAAEQQANDPARVRAMQEMRRQSGQ